MGSQLRTTPERGGVYSTHLETAKTSNRRATKTTEQ
ncbi:protein of unknown function [Trichlorobacter ammonificans]|uniref:Uncharacterized protein n=1 Tax=Trichlorobacter ammonificans TaxID=2916410 RepID=A0ABN8HGU9_9BACT|nr:protein of unknown function [Trichlorobacter ammonificans]